MENKTRRGYQERSARTGLLIKNLIPTDPFGDADLADL